MLPERAVVSVVVFCVVLYSDCWKSTEDVYIAGTGTANDAKTVDECQAACVNNNLCVGINWFPGGFEESNCYIDTITAEAVTFYTEPWQLKKDFKTIFYELNRACPGEC